MADFQPDCESAEELYGQIMELNSLKISESLAGFINQYSLALDQQILQDIGKIKGMCEAIENEAWKYVRKARNFAKKKTTKLLTGWALALETISLVCIQKLHKTSPTFLNWLRKN